ncbi:MAG: prepilin-type N-terminal cleavage/methylation domain-containing protein [Candidatus Acidiferrum sp.]|jgi:prepilin-type N-terminal cleavage/methylation domain-containing protein
MKICGCSKTEAMKKNRETGFTLIEVILAIVVLLVGIVAVAQMVPASVSSNSTNRSDSSALVFAQRQMDQFLNQPLNMSSVPPTFIETIDGQTFTCYLGNPTQPNTVVGANTLIFYNQLVVDFTQAQGSVPTGYHFSYQDPNDPSGVTYDVRWAVVTTTNNGLVSGKRYILGVRKTGGNGIYQPVTLDSIVEK